MNIIVCIKQVPDSTQVKVDPKTGTLIRAGVPSILNPYDHFALEEAIKLKKATDAKVTVLSMGPPQAEMVLKLGLALGADKAILLSDRAFAGSDTWATSYALTCAIKKIGQYDVILCGQMAIDGDTAQTGPGIAFHLGIPQITFSDGVEIVGNDTLRANKIIDCGHEILESTLPVLVTMTMPVEYQPHHPSFVDIFNSQDKDFQTWSATDVNAEPKKLGLDGSPTRVDKIYAPEARSQGDIMQGSSAELANKMLEILKKEEFIK